MNNERQSFPPGIDGPRAITGRHLQKNDAHAESVKDIPLPAAVAIAALDLTDEQRLACARELWAAHQRYGYIHMDQTLGRWQKEARERLGKASP